MNNVIRGTEFSYRIDTEHGINHDGFIAEGTESIVFKGVKYGSGLRYSCALKFKPKSRLYSFMNREYKILESMQTCRSVVRVLDVIEDLGDFSVAYQNGSKAGEISNDNFFCVVEEYIDGDSLQDYCIKQWFVYDTAAKQWRRNPTEYSYREVVKYQNQMIQFMINFCEIMKFVSNVNERNSKTDPNKPIILHCDIKTENIMVTKHGRELVLIDFGRSQAISSGRTFQHYNDPAMQTYTADYSDVQWQDVGKDNFYSYGTTGYAAPECYAAPSKGNFPFISQSREFVNGCLSIESDIFSFGATFFECLSMYEICSGIFERASENDLSDPYFFGKEIRRLLEARVRISDTLDYCDRDFRNIDIAYHEALEDIIRKATRTRTTDFQDPDKTPGDFYHNFHELQREIERARDAIPSLDRKSDPLVRQMLGVSGFCAAFAVYALILWILLNLLAGPLARDRWNTLKLNYTDNQKRTTFAAVAEDMMEVPLKSSRKRNYEDILEFTFGDVPNDCVIDSDEADILAELMREHLPEDKDRAYYINVIIQNAKNDNMDDVAKIVYRLNLPKEYKSAGYDLAKALTQVNNADDSDEKILVDAYYVLMEHSEEKEYRKIVSKIAIKLMSGGRTDTVAASLGIDRETLQDTLAPLTKIGGD